MLNKNFINELHCNSLTLTVASNYELLSHERVIFLKMGSKESLV